MSSKPGKKILRIGLIQNGKIVEERLMRSAKTVTIGHGLKNNDLVVPASKLPKSFALFESKDGGYILHFTSKMSGRVSLGDGVRTLEQLKQEGQAKKVGDTHAVRLSPRARGKVKLGEVTVLFQFVTPPPPRPKPILPASMRGGWFKGIEPILAAIILISAIVQIGMVVWLENQEWPEQLDAAKRDIPDRFVKIMAEPKEEEPPEIPEDQQKPEEKEGEGEAKKKGEQEAKPAPKPEKKPAPSKEPKTAEERAKAEAERRKRMAESVRKKTILHQLGAVSKDGGGNLADTLAQGASQTSMKEAFEGSKGMKSGVLGAEKDGLRTSGSSDAEGTGATASVGDLGATSGAKAAEKGVDTGSKKEETVKARIDIKGGGTQVGTGTLSGSRISSVVRRGASAIQRCFERELKKNPNAGGKLVITFTIGRAGRVTQAKASTGIGGGFSNCAERTVKRWRFPRPKGGEVMVKKSFVLQASK